MLIQITLTNLTDNKLNLKIHTQRLQLEHYEFSKIFHTQTLTRLQTTETKQTPY